MLCLIFKKVFPCLFIRNYWITLIKYLTMLFDILQVSIWRVQTWKAATWLVWIFVLPHWKMQTFRTVIYELQCWQEQILRYIFFIVPDHYFYIYICIISICDLSIIFICCKELCGYSNTISVYFMINTSC